MNLRLLVPTQFQGGPFSKFFVAIQNALPYADRLEALYLASNYGQQNRFDYMFAQNPNLSYVRKICQFRGQYAKTGLQDTDNLGNLEDSKDYPMLKTILRKLTIRPQLVEAADKFVRENINDNTLGVHVRVLDYNKTHPNQGVYYIEDYIRKIEEVKEKEQVSNIFVSSDSTQWIVALQSKFRNVVSYDSDIRPYDKYLWRNINNRQLWEEMMVWALILSKCKTMVCRVSNGANAAILLAEETPKVYRL